MLTEFLAWWCRQLTDALLAPLRMLLVHPAQPTLVVDVADAPGRQLDHVTMALREKGKSRALGSIPADASGGAALGRALGPRRMPRQIVAQVPPECLLERRLELPPAAAHALPDIIRLEVERLTPFAVEDMAWTWAAEPRERAGDALRLRVAMVPLAVVRPTVAALGRIGLQATALEAEAEHGPAWRFDLRPARKHRPGTTRALAAACAALALLALSLPFALQWRAERSLDMELAALRAPMRDVDTLRRSLQQGSAGATVITAEIARLGAPLQTLAALTSALADDSYLQELGIDGDRLLLTGQSGGAARLLGTLAVTPGFQDPVFVAPVRRTEDGTAELFSLRVGYRP
jgi:general secretion pathway protein L